jgi:hypothetical protein
MTCGMRIVAILMGAALAVSTARSEPLSSADREALLERLAKLDDAATSKLNIRYRKAITAYRDAMGSDDAAMEFYLKCIEKVNFTDQQKKTSDFLAWKRQDSIKAKLADPAFRLSLRYQLRWLVLTLEATSESAKRSKIVMEAQEIVDSIFGDASRFAGQEQELAQAVTGTVFARAYEIGALEKNSDEEKWPLSPIQLGEVYDALVLPPLRSPGRIDSLRAAWIKRIQQEIAKNEAWAPRSNVKPGGISNGNLKGNGKGEHKIGMAADSKNLDSERFMTRTVPELQWQMESDLFASGDESAAAMRMLAHLEKFNNHPSSRQWREQFENMLKPKETFAPRKHSEPASE